MTAPERPGPERPGPEYPPEWDAEPERNWADSLAEARTEVDPEIWPEFIAQVRDDLRRLW